MGKDFITNEEAYSLQLILISFFVVALFLSTIMMIVMLMPDVMQPIEVIPTGFRIL